MKKVTEETSAGKSEARPSRLDDLIQQGARQIVQQAIEAELAALLERYDNVKTLDGRRTVIRNGYLPEREVVTAIGPAPGHREGAEGSRSLGLGREVQFEHRAALHSEVTPRVSGVALAVLEQDLMQLLDVVLVEGDVPPRTKHQVPDLGIPPGLLTVHQSPSQQHVDHDKGHGRVETRMIDTFIPPNAWLPEGWQPLVQAVVKVVRGIEHKRKGVAQTSEETAWWISTVALSAEQFQGAIRGHWSVENQNHHVRDVVMFEDACRIRAQPGILARLRSIALNCMRANDEPCISRAIYKNTLNFNHAVSVAHGNT